MNDVRRLLVIKADIERVMQEDLEPSVRVFAEHELDNVCKKIEEAREDFSKLFEPKEIDHLRSRMAELETSNAALIKTLSTVRQFIVDGRGFGLVYTPEEDEDDILAVVDNAIKKEKGKKK